MKKCEVLVERVSLIVGKGSIVYVDDRQYEIAKKFLKPLENEKKVEKVEEVETREEKPLEKEQISKKK